MTDSPDKKREQPAAQPTANPEPPPKKALPKQPVEAGDFVFIGKAHPFGRLDCESFGTNEAPHRRPPSGDLHDASDYPERHSVQVDVIETVQNPSSVSPRIPPATEPRLKGKAPQAYVAFALGMGAFRSAKHRQSPSVYDKQYCQRLNGWLAAKYLVVHAFGVHVDRGNSAPDPWLDVWHSLGTNPVMGNAGFETLKEAQAYARSLIDTARSAKD